MILRNWRVWVAGAVVLLVLGFMLGRGSRGISPKLQWQVDSLRATAGEFQRSRDSARFQATRLMAEADSLVRERKQLVINADVSAQVARDLLRKVRNLDTLLARVETAADSLPIVVEQRDQALEAVGHLEAEAGSLRAGLDAQIEASGRLRATIEVQAAQLVRDADRLAVAEGMVVKLVKRGSKGCRVPILGIRCPILGAGYGLTLAGGEVRHGVTVAALIPLP